MTFLKFEARWKNQDACSRSIKVELGMAVAVLLLTVLRMFV